MLTFLQFLPENYQGYKDYEYKGDLEHPDHLAGQGYSYWATHKKTGDHVYTHRVKPNLRLDANYHEYEPKSSKSYFWMQSGMHPNIRKFIEKHKFLDPTLGCQDESKRWAKKFKEYKIPVEIHHGIYDPDFGDGNHENAGHTWLRVGGHIFDPTAAQFSKRPREDHYHTHEVED